MKILEKNLKQGEITLRLDSKEDSWYLSRIVDVNDVIKGKTVRKMKVSEEADATKRTVFIALLVEKVDFEGSSVRIGGKIIDGPEDVPRGNYHTFTLEEHSVITIKKRFWLNFQLDYVEEACSDAKSQVLVCVFDREEALFAVVRHSQKEILAHLKGDVAKKRMEVKTSSNFFEEIVEKLTEYDLRFVPTAIVLGSPAFWKDELVKKLSPQLKKKSVSAVCSSVNERSVDEIFKQTEVQSALKKARFGRELALVERLLAEISKSGLVVYGVSNVENAANSGAISTLLVTDSLIQKNREAGTFDRLELILRSVDNQKGDVVIVSSENDAGKKLNGLGGIAAFIRWAM